MFVSFGVEARHFRQSISTNLATINDVTISNVARIIHHNADRKEIQGIIGRVTHLPQLCAESRSKFFGEKHDVLCSEVRRIGQTGVVEFADSLQESENIGACTFGVAVSVAVDDGGKIRFLRIGIDVARIDKMGGGPSAHGVECTTSATETSSTNFQV